jgi:hypothetical protein
MVMRARRSRALVSSADADAQAPRVGINAALTDGERTVATTFVR